MAKPGPLTFRGRLAGSLAPYGGLRGPPRLRLSAPPRL